MRRADAAELILSLVTSRERATAMAGDLLEDAERSGSFWPPVARTALSQFWGQLSTRPPGLGRATLTAFLLMLGFGSLGIVLLLVGWAILISVWKVDFGRDLPDLGSQAITTFLFYVGVNFAVGRRIARHWPGREGAVSFGLVVLIRAIGLGADLVFWLVGRYGGGAHAVFTIEPVTLISWTGDIVQSLATAVPWFVTDFVTLTAGAAYQRAKMLKSTVA
jgi:hypothetical protein